LGHSVYSPQNLCIVNFSLYIYTLYMYFCYVYTIKINQSTLLLQNHKIERMWPEVNQRVNYPIAALVELMDADALNVDDDVTKFCLSNLSIQLAEVGIQQFVESWNAHRVPGS